MPQQHMLSANDGGGSHNAFPVISPIRRVRKRKKGQHATTMKNGDRPSTPPTSPIRMEETHLPPSSPSFEWSLDNHAESSQSQDFNANLSDFSHDSADEIDAEDEVVSLSDETSSNISGDEASDARVFGPMAPPKHTRKARVDETLVNLGQALSNEAIGKFLAHDCGCGKDCTAQLSRHQVHTLRCATYTATQNNIMPPTHALQLLNIAREFDPIHNKTNFEWCLGGHGVCEDTFRMAHGISKTAFRRARQASLKGLADIPKREKSKRGKVASRGSEEMKDRSERGEQTKLWLAQWVELHGCKMPDQDVTYIEDVPIQDLCKECRDDIAPICRPLQLRQFRRVWATNFHKWCKKRARKPFGTCVTCAGYKARIHKHARDAKELKALKEEYSSHILETKLERQAYYKHRRKALEASALSMIVDGMDQSKLLVPHFMVPPKDQTNFLDTKITGVLVHGKCFDAYVSEPQVRHDTNLNLTCVHATLTKLLKQGPLPRTFYLQVDGGSENKNKWMMSYLSLLVEMGIFDVVKMSYLPVGHTHEDIDQAFSRIAVHLNRHDAYTFDDYLSEIKKSFIKDGNPPNVITVGAAYDFKGWLNDRLADVSSYSDNLVFRFSKNPATGGVQMHYKFLATSPRYFCASHAHTITSFKAVARQARENPNVWVDVAGIAMGQGVPHGAPPLSKAVDFLQVDKGTNSNSSNPR